MNSWYLSSGSIYGNGMMFCDGQRQIVHNDINVLQFQGILIIILQEIPIARKSEIKNQPRNEGHG